MPVSSSSQEIFILAESSLSLAHSLTLSLSPEPFTPYSEGTVLSLAWHPERSSCQVYRHAIALMSAGGGVLTCGGILSGLHFSGYSNVYAHILGPAMVSFGLMVLVVGVVLVPITRDAQRNLFRKMCSMYGSQSEV